MRGQDVTVPLHPGTSPNVPKPATWPLMKVLMSLCPEWAKLGCSNDPLVHTLLIHQVLGNLTRFPLDEVSSSHRMDPATTHGSGGTGARASKLQSTSLRREDCGSSSRIISTAAQGLRLQGPLLWIPPGATVWSQYACSSDKRYNAS